MKNYAIKDGYVAREQNTYYEDYTGTAVYQPDVYTAAVKFARNSGAKTIIDIGSGNGEKLIPYADEFKFMFVDYGSNLAILKQNFGKRGTYLEQDFETGVPKFTKNVLKSAVIICSDVIEHINKPDILIKSLVWLAGSAPLVVISTPDRQAMRGVSDYGPPLNAAHVREWSMEELDSLFRANGLHSHLTGRTRSNSYEQVRHTTVIVAGTFVDDLSKPPAKTTDLDEFLAQPTIVLPPGEQLASPIHPLRVDSLLLDAKNKGYGRIEAQVVYIDPNATYAWPEDGVVRQGHGLIGLLGEVRTFTVSKSAKNSTYPFHLTIFSPSQKLDLADGLSGDTSKLIDVGHLADDYLLETLAGWDILGPKFGN